MKLISVALSVLIAFSVHATLGSAAVMEFGDEDVLGTDAYGGDPKQGATLEGLAPDVVTFGAPAVGHGFPFTPAGDDFPGTDQIYAGSAQTGQHDGYSGSPRLNGPQTLTLDYSSLVPVGESVTSLTLGIAADDFQFGSIQQPFAASVNGVPHDALTAVLNSLDQGGPVVQFFTIGIEPALLDASHVLTVAIDQGGDGGDGWAVDFLTVGVTSAVVPEPTAGCLLALACGPIAFARRRL